MSDILTTHPSGAKAPPLPSITRPCVPCCPWHGYNPGLARKCAELLSPNGLFLLDSIQNKNKRLETLLANPPVSAQGVEAGVQVRVPVSVQGYFQIFSSWHFFCSFRASLFKKHNSGVAWCRSTKTTNVNQTQIALEWQNKHFSLLLLLGTCDPANVRWHWGQLQGGFSEWILPKPYLGVSMPTTCKT